MAKEKAKTGGGSKKARRGAAAEGGRFQPIGDSASEVVKQAAAVLEEELAAGVVASQRIQERFRAERRVDQGEVDDVVERFRSSAHELVEVVGERIAEMGSGETQDLAKRFLGDAHGLLDAAANLATFAPELVNRLVASDGGTATAAGAKKPPAKR